MSFAHESITKIMRAAIDRVDPARVVVDCLSLDKNNLKIATENDSLTIDLSMYQRVVVLGAGKASAAMARGLEHVLGDRITDGIVAVKHGYAGSHQLQRVRLIETGHPVPDSHSVRAGREIAGLARESNADTLCLSLISGGGSALLTLPADGLRLEDVQATTRLLLAAGTPITEINCVRKHISGIAGGRFCRFAAPATVVALILSDVVGDDLGSIASGLTVADPTTFDDAVRICKRYGIYDRLPTPVMELLERGAKGDVEETPKPGDLLFKRVHNVLIGSNAIALDAARIKAEALGYNTMILTSRLTGEAREIARVFSAIGEEIVRRKVPFAAPACVLAGGETTVTLRGSGKGGRNQEMALAALVEMALRPEAFSGVTFLSFGTDGNDGPTDAAGGWASVRLLDEIQQGNTAMVTYRSLLAAMDDNDSYNALGSLGAHCKTGPTNTNVCDIQILVVEPT